MNNVEIEDVYHHDFTTASEWEVFIARLEEIIHEWKLHHSKAGPPLKEGDFVNLSWEENAEKLNFADVEFILKHYRLKTENDNSETSSNNLSLDEQEDTWSQCQKDIMNSTNDFVHIDENFDIARFYGLREYILLVPAKRSSISDETRIKILLSSLTIAVHNAECDIPAFVQVLEQWQKYYLGINVGRRSRTHLNMVHLKKIPPHCRHLTGLLTLFKQKIGEGSDTRFNPVMVSVRLSYTLKDWTSCTWTQEPPDFDFLQGETVGVDELGKLPFGATFDPIKEFHLFVSWPEIFENVVVDSEGFSDLEPLSAPEWSLQVEMVHEPACLLGEYLFHFLQLCSNQKSLPELLGEGAAYFDNENQSFSTAFNKLTESRIPSISTIVNKAPTRKNIDGPITEDLLLPILNFLFPDAEEVQRAPYAESSGYSVDDDLRKGIKTCAIDSLVWRLAIVAAHSAYNLGGLAALAQLWHEFVQEIRFRWEKCIPIPGVGPGMPDCVHTCLLHQKLQMVNYCITRRKAREEMEHKVQGLNLNGSDSSDSEEDEFFECLNEDPNESSKYLPWNRPLGRQAKHPTLLLVKTGDPLYLPVTQEAGSKTEDQLDEDAQVMMQLGTGKTASEMRAKLMSASLLSDMESFKAANPSAVLEDFIRWYSPRDWIEEPDKLDEWGQPAGRLSPRMLIPDNPWSSTWASAQPVPAHRQRRLFDDTREAEKVLHFLGSRRLGQVGQLLLPVLAHAALVTLLEQPAYGMPSLPDVCQAIRNRLQFATKPLNQNLQIYEEIFGDIQNVEALITQVNSLQLKLADGENDSNDKELQSFLIQLMRGKEVPVPNGPRGALGARISKMFSDAQKAAYMMTSSVSSEADIISDSKFKPFPVATSKEFILRKMSPRPTTSSTVQPQRLYIYLDRDSIRMAGAFTEDTIFF